MIVTEPQAELAEWVGEKIGVQFFPPYTIIASQHKGKTLAAAVFNVWTKNDIECSVAIDKFLPIELLKACRHYVEHQLGCSRITFRTRSGNQKAQKALKKLGAVLEGRQRGYFGDEDGLLFGLILKDTKHGFRTIRSRSS